MDVPFSQIAGALSEADDLLGRLDEAVRTSPVATGLRARLDYVEAIALALSEGTLVDADELLLHDMAMDARPPTHELAHSRRLYLAARQAAGAGDPVGHLTRAGLRRLVGLPGQASSQPVGLTGLRSEIAALRALAAELEGGATTEVAEVPLPPSAEDPEAEDAFRRWRALQPEADALPPVLTAVFMRSKWHELAPLSGHGWLGAVIAALVLRARGRSRHVMLPVEVGARLARRERGQHGSLWEEGLAAILGAVKDAQARHARLLLAAERVEKLTSARRGDSHLRTAGQLAIDRPLITAKLVEEHCGVSDRAAQKLIAGLSPLLVEITGRQRYRAWRLS